MRDTILRKLLRETVTVCIIYCGLEAVVKATDINYGEGLQVEDLINIIRFWRGLVKIRIEDLSEGREL